jgi:hypothetical protein
MYRHAGFQGLHESAAKRNEMGLLVYSEPPGALHPNADGLRLTNGPRQGETVLRLACALPTSQA